METYLKIFFSIFFITALTAIPAQADIVQASPAQAVATPAQQAPAVQAAPALTPKPVTYYNYAHDEAEYSVTLPEAPTVRTLWAESPDTTPYIENPPNENAAIGEVATFKRVDIDTEEVFDVKITFVKAKKSFLQSLTRDKIKGILTKQYKDTPLSNELFNMSAGKGPLKWATISGFSLDKNNHPSFCAMHYLVGQQSILVVQIMYSIENKTFQEYYDHLVNSITYVAP